MFPLDIVSDPARMERDALRTDLCNSLGVITGRAQLLQRQVLRSHGLISLDRDHLIHGLATLLAEVERMETQIEDLTATGTSHVDLPSAPFPIMPTPTALPCEGGPLISRHRGEAGSPADCEPQ